MFQSRQTLAEAQSGVPAATHSPRPATLCQPGGRDPQPLSPARLGPSFSTLGPSAAVQGMLVGTHRATGHRKNRPWTPP